MGSFKLPSRLFAFKPQKPGIRLDHESYFLHAWLRFISKQFITGGGLFTSAPGSPGSPRSG
jgi:hypothetical protein